jgi:hypothetical protein
MADSFPTVLRYGHHFAERKSALAVVSEHKFKNLALIKITCSVIHLMVLFHCLTVQKNIESTGSPEMVKQMYLQNLVPESTDRVKSS